MLCESQAQFLNSYPIRSRAAMAGSSEMIEHGNETAAPVATIVITTKNRCTELRRTLQSCLTQQVCDGEIEILVVDDDSDDGTREMIAAEFPTVRLVHKTSNPGYIVSRNLAARLAKGPVIVSIDDDAIFTGPDIVECVVRDFAESRIGAVAIPHVHVTDGPREYHRAPDSDRVYIGPTFTGTAHAVRRDLFLSLGGYREVLVHQGEEIDYCVRLLNAGYYVRLGTSRPIHHYPSLKRNYPRQLYYGARNSVLITWFNAPWYVLPFRIASNIAGGLYHAMRSRHPSSFAAGALAGFGSLFAYNRHRQPIASKSYRLVRRLQKLRALPLTAVI
jgi:glycosyltransferase involved in cell wall biosynthesis